jgi:hypothetical protein
MIAAAIILLVWGGCFYAWRTSNDGADRCREVFGSEAQYYGPGQCRIEVPDRIEDLP